MNILGKSNSLNTAENPIKKFNNEFIYMILHLAKIGLSGEFPHMPDGLYIELDRSINDCISKLPSSEEIDVYLSK